MVKFSLGRMVATPGALRAVEKSGDNLLELVETHANGDWGEVSPGDGKANDAALKDGDRILSAYRLRDGVKVWVITEADRSSTCVLLPSEY